MAEYPCEREKRPSCPVPAILPIFPYPGDNLPSRTVLKDLRCGVVTQNPILSWFPTPTQVELLTCQGLLCSQKLRKAAIFSPRDIVSPPTITYSLPSIDHRIASHRDRASFVITLFVKLCLSLCYNFLRATLPQRRKTKKTPGSK